MKDDSWALHAVHMAFTLSLMMVSVVILGGTRKLSSTLIPQLNDQKDDGIVVP